MSSAGCVKRVALFKWSTLCAIHNATIWFICRVRDDDEDEEDLNDRKSPNDTKALLSQEMADDPKHRPYRLWYTIEVQSSAPNPERTLEVTCAAHSAVAVDIAVTNPTRERIVMDVLIDGVALSGEPTVTLHPRQQVIYQVAFAPTVIGEYAGRWELLGLDLPSSVIVMNGLSHERRFI